MCSECKRVAELIRQTQHTDAVVALRLGVPGSARLVHRREVKVAPAPDSLDPETGG